MTEQKQAEQSNSRRMVAGPARDFYGFAGAGPLNVERIEEDDNARYVRVALGEQGVYLEQRVDDLARHLAALRPEIQTWQPLCPPE